MDRAAHEAVARGFVGRAVLPGPSAENGKRASEVNEGKTHKAGALTAPALCLLGDPDGIRTHDLHRDRVACLAATPRGRLCKPKYNKTCAMRQVKLVMSDGVR